MINVPRGFTGRAPIAREAETQRLGRPPCAAEYRTGSVRNPRRCEVAGRPAWPLPARALALWFAPATLLQPLLTLEAARLLEALGAKTRLFDRGGLPRPDDVPEDHAKVQELRALSDWSEA